MLLAVDAGNTNTVIGVFDGETLVESWRVNTDARRTADELALLFRGLLAMHGAVVEDVDGVAICSGVPNVTHELREMCHRRLNLTPVVVEPGTKTGVPILIDNPKEVGADRVVNSLAAFHLFGGPCVVADFGTAVNFDVVSEKGEYLGGALAPGIEISLDALASRGAQLRKVELTKPRSVIGKGTVEGMQSGFLYGFAGLVDGIFKRMKAELGEQTAFIVTGGLAPLVVDVMETPAAHEPNLTLIGLRLVHEKNR